jgi:hypothetical protein
MKTQFVSRFGEPITGARPQMRPSTAGGPAGSIENAEAQIRQAPQPFQTPQGAIRGVGSNQQFARQQVHGRPSARGTRPGANTANSPRSDPPSHGAQMTATGQKPDYRAGYAPSTHPKAKARIMRGQIRGAKPLIDNSDIFSAEGVKQWNQSRKEL